jgi:hypothetical protein
MGGTASRARSARRGIGLRGALVVAAAAALAAGPNARAAAPVLRWKFNPGESLHYQMEQKTVTEVKANNQNVKSSVNQTLDTTWAVKAVDTAGKAEMTQTIDRIRAKIEHPFGAFEYDSKDGKQAEDKLAVDKVAAGLVPIFKALVGATFKFKISPQGELSDIQVPEGLIKSLREAGPTAANAGMFSEDGLKNMIRESSLVLPDQAADKPWTRQSKIPSPPIGTLVVDKTYSYDGKDADGEKIGLATKITLEAAPNANFEVKIGNQEGKGTFVFDSNVGRVVRSNVTQKLEMVITVMNTQVTQSTDTATVMSLLKAEGGSSR